MIITQTTFCGFILQGDCFSIGILKLFPAWVLLIIIFATLSRHESETIHMDLITFDAPPEFL